MKWSFLVIAAVLAASSGNAQDSLNEELRSELLEMGRRDQEVREKLTPFMVDGTESGQLPQEALPVLAEMLQVDEANLRRMDEIVADHGWPGPQLVGEAANQAALLILEHADLEHQRRYLPILRRAVAGGRDKASNLAQLEDEISMAERGVQIYGTEIQVIQGNFVVAPVIDPERLDERRASVDLPPMEVYLQQAETELGQPVDRGSLMRKE